MALDSSKDTGKDAGKDAGRAKLPFEPKRDPKRNKKKAQQSAADKELGSESGSESDSSTQISAKAQARADEILAGNRRKAKAKAGSIKGAAAKGSSSARKANSGAIPEAVSRRMLRRMAVLSGAPVLLGVGIFFLAYYLQSNQIVAFPPVAVLLVTMGCFGLGVLGLTYGVLSASWDTEPGSLLGLSEFKLNFGRVMDARKASNS
jgi:vacuolar-type H+-ATPase subunit H